MPLNLKNALENVDLADIKLDGASTSDHQVLSAVRDAIRVTKDRAAHIGHNSSHQTHADHSTSPNRVDLLLKRAD